MCDEEGRRKRRGKGKEREKGEKGRGEKRVKERYYLTSVRRARMRAQARPVIGARP